MREEQEEDDNDDDDDGNKKTKKCQSTTANEWKRKLKPILNKPYKFNLKMRKK